MSIRVLIIPEDFRKDQYMLKPLIGAIFEALDKPNAKIEVCKRPLLRGIDQALDRERLADILEDYGGMVDLFLLCVARDCQLTRRSRLNDCELWAEKEHQCVLIAENAWQEIEVWVLAGHDLPIDWSWQAVRGECDPKEVYFMPFAERYGVIQTPAEGRKTLAEEAARRYDRIRQLYPEDIAVLEDKIRDWLENYSP